MESIMTEPVLSTKKRTVNCREVDNGFLIQFTVSNPEGNTPTERYMEKELVVMNLPSLLKKLKLFFEPIIVEGE